MGIGKEVAEAYINVHGDIEPFRKDLEKARDAGAAAGREAADGFAQEFEKRAKDEVGKRWGSITDALYSGDKVDWDRAIGKFDSTDLDSAHEKILSFMRDMTDAGKLSEKQYNDTSEAIGRMIREKQQDFFIDQDRLNLLRDHTAALAENTRLDKTRADSYKSTVEDAIRENDRYDRSFDGMIKKLRSADLENDFRGIADADNSVDFTRFAKNFDSFDGLRNRVTEVTDAMREQGRVSDDNANRIHANLNEFIRGENEKSQAMRDELDTMNRLRDATDKWNRSLDGIGHHSEMAQLESDFRKLASAINSNDWSGLAKGKDDMDSLVRSTLDLGKTLRDVGRISDAEYGKIISSLHAARQNQDLFNISFKEAGKEAGRFSGAMDGAKSFLSGFSTVMGKASSLTQGFREHLGGFAGLNVFGDLINEGLDFVHNLDRIALSAATATTKLATMASVGGSALTALFPIASDLAGTFNGLLAFAPAFGTGLGLMAYVAIATIGGIAKQYKTELTKIKEDMLKNVMAGLKEPLDAFREKTLPTFSQGLKDTASSMGKLFGAILTQISDSASPDRMATMFGRMNGAMDKSQEGVKHFVDAWITLGDVGSQYFDRFAGWINDMGAKFDDFITKAAADGRIKKWMDDAIEGMKNLGRIIGATAGIFGAISKAAQDAGFKGLGGFADKLEALRRTMDTIAFQRTLATYMMGIKDLTDKLGTALGHLGPAMESLAPTIQIALGHIGDAVSTIIGYVGQIFSNPNFQKGLRDFTGGIDTAIKNLAPAIKPFGDAIGQTMTLLSEILVSISDIVTAVTVQWHPIFTTMSKQMETLIKPLQDSVQTFIKEMTPLLQSIADNIITPLVTGIRDDLLPAVDKIMPKVKDAGEAISKNLGEIIKPVVEKILPNLIKLAGDVLDPLSKLFALFTPVVVSELNDMGDGLQKLADAIDAVNKSVKTGDGGQSIADWFAKWWDDGVKKTRSQDENQSKQWGDLGKWFGDGFKWLWDQVVNAFTKYILNPKAWEDLFGGIGDMIKNSAGMKALKDIKKALEDWWSGVKGMFQDWFKKTFGFGGKESPFTPATIGGKGMSAGSPLTDAIFNEQNEKTAVQKFFDAIGKFVKEKLGEIGGWFKGRLDEALKPWNDFWGGLPDAVKKGWDMVVLWVTTKATEVKTNWDQFITDVGTNWNNFWDGIPGFVQRAWDAVVLWVQTKAGEVKTNWDTFISDVKTGWENFWTNLPTVVSTAWASVVSWVSTKAGEVKTNWNSFISDVQTNWNNFWTNLPGNVKKGWEDIVAGINAGIDNAMNWLGMLPQKAVNAISTFPGKMKTAGQDGMQGFINGLNGMLKPVTDTASTIAAAALAAAKLALNSNSPSKKFFELGNDVGNGLILGVEDKITAVMASAAALANAALGVFGKSQMYLAGADAAQGLADGFASNTPAFTAALGQVATTIPVSVAALGKVGTTDSTGGVDRSTGAHSVVVQSGAIQFTTPATDGKIVASQVLDKLVTKVSTL